MPPADLAVAVSLVAIPPSSIPAAASTLLGSSAVKRSIATTVMA
jgi:hypothetical protein